MRNKKSVFIMQLIMQPKIYVILKTPLPKMPQIQYN